MLARIIYNKMFWNKKSLRIQERELEEEEAKKKKKKRILERTNKLKEEKRSFKKKKKITTTKLLVAFLFINCTLIELFTAWITAKSLQVSYMTGNPIDFSPLVTLIGAVVSEVIGFAVYAIKATKENTANGITYMVAQQQYNNSEDDTSAKG